MPKLPDETALGGLPNVAERPMVSLPDVKTGEGEILGGLASGAKALGEVITAKQNEADDYDVQKKVIEFDLAQEKRLDDAKRAVPPEAKDFTAAYRSGYDRDARQFMGSIPDRLKPKVDEILVKRGANFEKRAYDFELLERDRFHVQDVHQQTSDLVTRSMGNPEAMADNAERGMALIRSSKLSSRAKVDFERKFLDMNTAYGLESMINREIEAGRDAGDLIDKLRKVQRGSMAGAANGAAASASSDDDLKAAVKRFEGFTPKASWDYKQSSVGYGTKALSRNEVIDKDEAERRLDEELGKAAAIVDRFKPGLDRGTRKALISLTFNAGDEWTTGGLGKAVQAGDDAAIRERFVQYNKAGGKTLPGLAARRKEEASWIGTGGGSQSAETAPVANVERTALPDVGIPDVAKGENTNIKVDPETGKATVSADIGDTKSDIPPKPTPGEATAKSDEPVESDEVPYPHLLPQTRRKLINYARTAGRAVVTKGVDDDIAMMRRGLEPIIGGDGKTSLDRARVHMTNMQWLKAKEKWEAAADEYKDLSPLRYMTADEQTKHINSIVSNAQESGRSLARAAAREKAAVAAAGKIQDGRDKDPVRFIKGFDGEDDGADQRKLAAPEIMTAMRTLNQARNGQIAISPDGVIIPLARIRTVQEQADAVADARIPGQFRAPGGGALKPSEEWKIMFDARLAAQQAIMPDDPQKHRIIDKEEAGRLLKMPKDGKGLDHKIYKEKLEQAATRASMQYPSDVDPTAEAVYGSKIGKNMTYAQRALHEAIHFQLNDKEHEYMRTSVIRKLASGQPVLVEDMRALHDEQSIGRTSLGIALNRIGRPSQPQIGPTGGNQGLPAIAQSTELAPSYPAPSPKQAEWLKANPDAVSVFDDKFGPGAASRILSRPVVGTGKAGVKPSDSTEFDWSKRKPGWSGR